MTTQPANSELDHTAPVVIVAPSYKDPITGMVYIHQDLLRVQEPWAEEAHVKPMQVNEKFGDVASFVAYVKRYGSQASLLTWNSRGLFAVLDYAASSTEPGRRQWIAGHPFVPSHQWTAWTQLANGQSVNQRAAVEKLEDLAEDIVEPSSAELTALLRNLKSNVNTKAEAELRPDGTAFVAFQRDQQVQAKGIELPAFFKIAIPVLSGHTDKDGNPVLYGCEVRVRVSIDSDAKLALRFSIPKARQILEDVYADRVAVATELLGAEHSLLRAADGN